MHSFRGRMHGGICVICELVSEASNLLHCLLTNKQQGQNFIIDVFVQSRILPIESETTSSTSRGIMAHGSVKH